MTTEIKINYTASDGKEFPTLVEAEDYQALLDLSVSIELRQTGWNVKPQWIVANAKAILLCAAVLTELGYVAEPTGSNEEESE